MPNVVLVCLDEVAPPSDGTCTTTAWVEQPSMPFPELSIAEAESIGVAFTLAMAAIGAALLLKRA